MHFFKAKDMKDGGISRPAVIGISLGAGVVSLAIILGSIIILTYRQRLAMERSAIQPSSAVGFPRLDLGGFNGTSQMSPAFPSLIVSLTSWK